MKAEILYRDQGHRVAVTEWQEPVGFESRYLPVEIPDEVFAEYQAAKQALDAVIDRITAEYGFCPYNLAYFAAQGYTPEELADPDFEP